MDNNQTCCICIEIINGDLYTLQECNHIFHTKCINTYSIYNDECPLCRKQFMPIRTWQEITWKALINKYDENLINDLIQYGKKSLYPFDKLGISGLYHPVLRAHKTGYSWRIIKELLDVSWNFIDKTGRSHDIIKDIYPKEYADWEKTKTLYEPNKLLGQNKLTEAIKNGMSDDDIIGLIAITDFSYITLLEQNPMINAVKLNRLRIVKVLSKITKKWPYIFNCGDKVYDYALRLLKNNKIDEELYLFLKENNI